MIRKLNKIALAILSFTILFTTGCSLEDDIKKDKFTITVKEDTTTRIDLNSGIATSNNESNLSTTTPSNYRLSDAPDHGEIVISGNILIYTPDEDFFGADFIALEQGDEDFSDYREVELHITVESQPEGNDAPTISGYPTTSISTSSHYYFKPIAKDKNGDKLTFSITNKPSWASFNKGSGELSGTTPNYSHTYSDVLIIVTDGQEIAELPLFSINVENENEQTQTDQGTSDSNDTTTD